MALLRHALGSRTQSDLAEELGVGEATVSRWLADKNPPRAGLKKLIAWAARQPPLPSPPDVLAEAVTKTGENLVRLSTISGYARAVLEMMRSVTEQQQYVVDSLGPWVNHEAAAVDALPVEVLAEAQTRMETTTRAAGKTRPSRRASGDL